MSADNAEEALVLTEAIKPLLAGRGPFVQGAVLVNLTSLWLAGHPKVMREKILNSWIKSLRELVPVSEAEIFGDGPRPEGWDE